MRTKSVFLILLILTFLSNKNSINAQNGSKLKIVTETIIKPKFINQLPNIKYNIYFRGFDQKDILLMYENINYERFILILDENSYNLKPNFNKLASIKKNTNVLYIYNSYVLYKKYSFKTSSNIEYQKLYVQLNNKDFLLDSIDNPDKKVYNYFSEDGKNLIINTFYKMADYYDLEKDNKFDIYSLDSIMKGKVYKTELPCSLCTGGRLIGNKFFFTKARGKDDTGNFEWTDIYMASLDNLSDTIKIASFSDILAISPDGKYILGTRRNDLPNYPVAIFDVENKKYQLMIGRQYSKYRAFYSYEKEKFAFWIEQHIVYIDFPHEYPFDALRKDNPDIPSWSNDEFYKQFEKDPLNK
ncbi:MAG: hypothetical protein AB7S50_09950 [Bacteroidales bacterium]